MKKEHQFQLDLAFFGLTSSNAAQFRKNILTEVHEAVYYGGGGYTWSEVYNMPIYLRRFTLLKIKEHIENVNKAVKPKDSKNQTLIDSSGKVNAPQFKAASSKYK